MLDMYGDVASGLKACLQHMGPWSVGDLILGLRHVRIRHDAHDVSDNIPGNPVSLSSNPQIFQYLQRECALACAAYSIPDINAITTEAHIASNSDILHVHEVAGRFKPAFFVMKDTEASLFRVVVRGTNDFNDILTDIAGHWEPIDGGHAHSGILQSAEWLLEQTVPLLQDIPFQDSQQYGLRFSGHSLGAGAAALATHLLHTQPHRFPTLLAAFPRHRIDCFCASAPPVLSLALARTSADYITALTLGHDVVARASIANFEQLRLEVLTSGWWEEMVDPVVKSDAFRKVSEGLERAGAGQLIALARSAGQTSAQQRAAERGEPVPRSMIETALDHLHEVYTQPTTERGMRAHSASSSHLGAVIEGLLVSSRERTRGVTDALLDRVATLSTKTPAELTTIAGSAAAAAWKAAAVASATSAAVAAARAPRTSQQLLQAGPGKRASGSEADAGATNTSEQGRSGSGSWWPYVAGTAAAATAAFQVVSEATRPGKGVDGAAGGKGARTRGAARVSSGSAPGCSAIGSVGSSGAAEPGVATGAAAAVSKLDMSITAERLYVAGRLLHLRRPPRASADAVEGAPPPGAAAAGGAAAAAGDGGAGGDLEEMVLVDGDPMDARFEFIAVRSTWVSDHSLTAMLAALKAASRHSPQ